MLFAYIGIGTNSPARNWATMILILGASFALFTVSKADTFPPISNGEATFQDLGFLRGGTNSRALGVSPNGQYVVGWSWFNSGSASQAFLWSRSTGMIPLGDLPGGPFVSEATDVSNNGVAVGTGSVEGGFGASEAFRWTQADGMLNIGTLGGSEIQAFGEGISADGAIIVGQSKNQRNTQVAFRWTQQTGMVELGEGVLPPSATSSANGISDDGTTIIGSGGVNFGGWRWREGSGFEELGALPQSNQSIPRAVSSDGSIVVGQSGTAFKWTPDTGIETLGTIPGGPSFSRAFGVSEDGATVVGDTDFNGVAFIWDVDYQMRNLQDALEEDFGLELVGWKLETAQDISANGKVIVGWATRPDGLQSAYRLTFSREIPEPLSIQLGVVGLAFISIRVRPKRWRDC